MLSRALAVGVALSGVATLAGPPWEHPPHPLWTDPNVVKPEACGMTRAQTERSLWQTNLWPGGVVPYAIDGGVTQQNRDRLRIAMNELETVCNVQFVERTSQSDYIYVQNGGGNNSFVGRIGGAQTVNLVSWSSRYTIVHELMHALGLWHEHQRNDRDSFVVINQANIQPEFFSANFPVQSGASPQGAYDFESIMHYDECSFSVCCPSGSICGCAANCRSIGVQPGFEAFATAMGNLSFMSQGDKDGLVSRYGTATDDSFEDNDTSPTAYSVDPGSYSLRLTDSDDYFSAVGSSGGALTVRLRAGLWSSSNVTVTLQTPVGVVLASGTPQDVDADGQYEVTLQTNAATGPTIVRVRRAQPWGGAYELDIARGCEVQPWLQAFPMAGPASRTVHAMAFDSARGVGVVFGGDTATGASGETWEWNGSQWTLKSSAGPSPRVHASMAYDAARGRVVLFGGRNGGAFFGDTWEWNGTNWSQVTTAQSPSSRSTAGMCYDSDRARIVLFGGTSSDSPSGRRGDTWEYDGVNWVQRSPSGPSPRERPALGYDPIQQRTVMFGGIATFASDETWEWNGASGAWTQTDPTFPLPPPRNVKNLVFHPVRQKLIMFGGYGGFSGTAFLGDFWEYNGKSWQPIEGPAPVGRANATVVWDATRGTMLMFGGEWQGESTSDELWSYDGASWKPLWGSSTPPAMIQGAMAPIESMDSMVLFGGQSADVVLGQTWLRSTSAWGQLAAAGPSARWGHFMAFDPSRGTAIMYGGVSDTSLQPVGVGMNEGVFSVLPWDPDGAGPLPTKLVAGGQFSTAGGSSALNLAVWDGRAWSALPGEIGGGVDAMTLWDPDGFGPLSRQLVIAGRFTEINGQPVNRVARWDGTAWRTLGSGLNSDVYAMTAWDPDGNGPTPEQLVVGGGFSSAGGAAVNNIARWDGSSWHALDVGVSDLVFALTSWDPDGPGAANPRLIAGGFFSSAGGNAASNVAQWNGFGWLPLGSGVNSTVRALLSWDPDDAGPQTPVLVVGGAFTSAGGSSALRVARWNGSNWQALGAGLNGVVATLGLHPEFGSGSQRVYAGGSFFLSGSNSISRGIARWTGSNWSSVETGIDGNANGLASWDADGAGPIEPRLIIGGYFTQAGGQPATHIAQWREFGNSLSDIWQFGPSGWEHLSDLQPEFGGLAAAAFDTVREQIVVRTLGSTWLWDETGWHEELSPSGPEPRYLSAMAFDPIREECVLFGGYSAGKSPILLNDTWVWNGTQWTQRTPSVLPDARQYHRMQFLSSLGKVVLWGGLDEGVNRTDVWAWDGTHWERLAENDGPACGAALAPTADEESLLTFGGSYGCGQFTTTDQTWQFNVTGGSPTITSEPSDRTNTVGTLATFTVLASPPSSSPSVSYQWYATVNNAGVEGVVALNNGDRGGRVTQVNGTTLRIANVQASDATSEPAPGVFVNKYFCVVSTPCRGVETRRAVLSVPAPVCSGDTNGDGRVDGADLSVLLGTFNQGVTPGTGADFNADGLVNGADLSVLLGRFGVVC